VLHAGRLASVGSVPRGVHSIKVRVEQSLSTREKKDIYTLVAGARLVLGALCWVLVL
jgi:hypothetical protein